MGELNKFLSPSFVLLRNVRGNLNLKIDLKNCINDL